MFCGSVFRTTFDWHALMSRQVSGNIWGPPRQLQVSETRQDLQLPQLFLLSKLYIRIITWNFLVNSVLKLPKQYNTPVFTMIRHSNSSFIYEDYSTPFRWVFIRAVVELRHKLMLIIAKRYDQTCLHLALYAAYYVLLYSTDVILIYMTNIR